MIRLEAYWEPFFCHAVTNGASSQVLPAVQKAGDPTHHCALGVGHHAGTLRKVARQFGLEFVEVGRS